MKKLKNLEEGSFLKLFFGFFSAAFLIAAVCMPDRNTMFSGLWQILSQPAKISTNYFAVGGYAATFLNMGLVGLCCLGLYALCGATVNNVSTLAFVLTLGFCSWGINILNIWPTVLGVVIYCLVKKEKFGANVNAMLFSTGIAPLISDLLVRYPNAEAVGFNLPGLAVTLIVGFCIGFFLPAGLAHSPKVHKGFDLYSAALPVGLAAFFLNATLYKTLGVDLPAAPSADTLQVASRLTVNLFCGILFGLCIVFALAMGCKPKQYWALLTAPEHVGSVSSQMGTEVFLMNVGVFGLFILAYYNLIGASFNGVTMGIIFCMLCYLQFRLPSRQRLADHAGVRAGVLPGEGAVQSGGGQFHLRDQRPGHRCGTVLRQRPESHYQQVRLVLGHGCGRDALFPGHLRPESPRRVLPV